MRGRLRLLAPTFGSDDTHDNVRSPARSATGAEED